MYTTNLRKVGGSIMMSVPPAILDLLHIGAGAKVGLAVDNGRIVVEPQSRPRYSLEELIAECDASAKHSAEEREWLNSHPAGSEIL
jgi:antitoxin ChpS